MVLRHGAFDNVFGSIESCVTRKQRALYTTGRTTLEKHDVADYRRSMLVPMTTPNTHYYPGEKHSANRLFHVVCKYLSGLAPQITRGNYYGGGLLDRTISLMAAKLRPAGEVSSTPTTYGIDGGNLHVGHVFSRMCARPRGNLAGLSDGSRTTK